MRGRKLTNTEFVSRVSSLHNGEYESLEPYVDYATKIKFRHKKCRHIFEMSPNTFYNAPNPCTKCYKRISGTAARRSQKTFEGDVKRLLGESYTVLGIYKSKITPVQIEHLMCKSIYSIVPKYLYEGFCHYKCAKEVK